MGAGVTTGRGLAVPFPHVGPSEAAAGLKPQQGSQEVLGGCDTPCHAVPCCATQ